MNRVKKIFALLFAIMAAMLMSTAVFAYTGTGTKNDPYIVTTFDDLIRCCKFGGYVKLGGNIVEESTAGAYIYGYTNLDLNGYSVEITNSLKDSQTAMTLDLFRINGCLEIADNGGQITLKDYTSDVFYVNSGGKLIVNSGIIKNYTKNGYSVIYIVSGGEAKVNGGEFSSYTATKQGSAITNYGYAVINGGIFSSDGVYGISNFGEMRVNGGILNDGLFTRNSLVVSGGEIHKLHCSIEKNKFTELKIYEGTFKDSMDLTGVKMDPISWTTIPNAPISNIVPEGSTVTVNGSKINRSDSMDKLEGASVNSTVEITSNKELIKNISLSGDLTPICGKSPVYPTNPNASLYDMTAHWYNYGSESEITSFSADKKYVLKLDFNLKNNNYLAGTFTDFDLKDTPKELYSVDKLTVTDTTLSVSFLFDIKPIITRQPYNPYGTDPMIGNGIYIDIDAENVQSYQWYFRGKDGRQQLLTNVLGLVYASDTTSPRLYLNIISKNADGCGVYCELKNGDNILISREYTINIPQYTVSYRIQFGEGSMPSQTVYSGETYTFPWYTAEDPDGYRFYKWVYTDNDGLYKYRSPGDTMEYNLGKDITISASYSKMYSVSFDANGGTGTMDPVILGQGDEFTFPDCTFTPPENKEFDHWLSLVTGTRSENAPGDKVKFNNDNNTVVSAVWKYKTYTVTFDTGGKCTPPPSQSVAYNGYAVDNGDPVADGYNFAGWYYDSTYSQVFSFYNRITEPTTLYAKWDEMSSEVGLSYGYSGYDLDNRKKLKVYYGDDLSFTTTETAGTAFGYYMVVNGDTYGLTYSDGYHPFVINDSTQVRRRIDGELIYYNAKSFINPNNTVYIYSMRVTDNRRSFTSVYELEIHYRPGDVDGNGKVNDTDAAMLLEHIGGAGLLDGEQLKRANLNNDGKIDMLDVIAILNS